MNNGRSELPAKGKYPRDGEAMHGGLVMWPGRSLPRHAGTQAKIILSADASVKYPTALQLRTDMNDSRSSTASPLPQEDR